MRLHADLLLQAEHLARRERRRPRQASLRRAISTAYYALFHLLTCDASRLYVKDSRLLYRLNRSYVHGKIAEVSGVFAKGDLPKTFNPLKGDFPIPQKLRDVAQAFVDLRQARHDADYDLAKKFTRTDAMASVERAKQAFRDWDLVRNSDLAGIHLACFTTWDQWDKAR